LVRDCRLQKGNTVKAFGKVLIERGGRSGKGRIKASRGGKKCQGEKVGQGKTTSSISGRLKCRKKKKIRKGTKRKKRGPKKALVFNAEISGRGNYLGKKRFVSRRWGGKRLAANKKEDAIVMLFPPKGGKPAGWEEYGQNLRKRYLLIGQYLREEGREGDMKGGKDETRRRDMRLSSKWKRSSF